MTDPDTPSTDTDPTATRIRKLTDRATEAGYVLVRSASMPHEWRLLDADYCEEIYVTTSLGEVAEWLDS